MLHLTTKTAESVVKTTIEMMLELQIDELSNTNETLYTDAERGNPRGSGWTLTLTTKFHLAFFSA